MQEYLNKFIQEEEEEGNTNILFYLTTKKMVKFSKMKVNIWQEAGYVEED